MRGRRAIRAVGIGWILVVLVVAAGCRSTYKTPTADGSTALIRLYGSDGNMRNSFGDALEDQPGVLAGMKGVTPLTPLSEDFKRRLRTVDPTLVDFGYAGEAYDAVMIAALASQTAGTTEPATVAKYVDGVTASGTTCDSVKTCFDLLDSNQDIRYRGVSLRRSGLTDAGEPSTALFASLQFGRDNRLNDGKTEFVGAGDESNESRQPSPAQSQWPQPPPRPVPSGSPSPRPTYTRPLPPPLKIGGLLPHTGSLASAGLPEFAGARLAIKEINDNGGVGGNPVQWMDGDDGTDAAVASSTVDRFVDNGVQVIIGAGSSAVTRAVLPKVVAAGLIMISPSATADDLSTVDDKGLFFRTAPPDVLRAKALGDVVMRDGNQRVVIVARDDSYGNGLAHNLQLNLTAGGIGTSKIRVVPYRAAATYDQSQDVPAAFAPIARSVKELGPDSIVIIGYDESALVIRAILAENIQLHS